MTPRLSKSHLMAYRQCPRRLWLQIHRPELAVEPSDQTERLAVGRQAGEIARQLHPGGTLINGDSISEALVETRQVLADGTTPVFEGTLEAHGALVRVDLLLPEPDGYRLVEVKSSGSVKDYHYPDLAIQAWVAGAAGVPLVRIELAHIDTSFVYPGGGDYQGLFHHEDMGATIAALVKDVPDWIGAARKVLTGPDPQTDPGGQCQNPFPCPFMEHCGPVAEDTGGYPPEKVLPNAGKVPETLRAAGYTDLRDVPEERLEKPMHRWVGRVTRTGEPELLPDAAAKLAGFGYPRAYLDFETLQHAIPIWEGVRPYAQIPFQWSCHLEAADGTLTHREFLAEGDGDPRRGFAESLLEALDGNDGPIFVYNAAFERTRLKELATAFPEHADGLEALIDRIVDLHPITRANYYHPEMRGSWSLKAVLPAVAPDLSYEGLDVANGTAAQQAFAETLRPDTKPARCAELRRALLEYCRLDTLALVRLAHFLEGVPEEG